MLKLLFTDRTSNFVILLQVFHQTRSTNCNAIKKQSFYFSEVKEGHHLSELTRVKTDDNCGRIDQIAATQFACDLFVQVAQFGTRHGDECVFMNWWRRGWVIWKGWREKDLKEVEAKIGSKAGGGGGGDDVGGEREERGCKTHSVLNEIVNRLCDPNFNRLQMGEERRGRKQEERERKRKQREAKKRQAARAPTTANPNTHTKQQLRIS